MNSKRPAEKPICNLRFSSGFIPCNARNDPTRSACGIGPPLARIDITALPTSIFLVRANIAVATWKKSVQRPTSPG